MRKVESCSSVGKESACNAGDLDLIPGLGRSLGKGNGKPLQCSGLENPMNRGGWQATVQGFARVRHDSETKSPTRRKVTGLACYLHGWFSLKTAITFVGSRIALYTPRILRDIHSRVKLNKIIFSVSSKIFLSFFVLLNWEFAVGSMTSASTVDAWPWSERRSSSLPTTVCAPLAPVSTQQAREIHPWIIMKVTLALEDCLKRFWDHNLRIAGL